MEPPCTDVERSSASISSILIESPSVSGSSLTSQESGEHGPGSCHEYNSVSICLFDLVGFSSWCAHQAPKLVMNTMIRFNELIQTKLRDYPTLTKIELVGDCCLVVGGMDECILTDQHSAKQSTRHVEEIVNFGISMITSNIGDCLFGTSDVSLRIGISIGDVIGTFLKTPTKFQLFGNAINLASRLESSSLPGILHVAEEVVTVLQGNTSKQITNLDYGKTNMHVFKGVGEVKSAYLTLVYPQTVLVLCESVDLPYTIVLSEDASTTIPFFQFVNWKTGLQRLRQAIYAKVLFVFSRGRVSSRIRKELKSFRSWEKEYRSSYQTIVGTVYHRQLLEAISSGINPLETNPSVEAASSYHVRFPWISKCVGFESSRHRNINWFHFERDKYQH